MCISVHSRLKQDMKILFITSSRIGDAVLSTGLLRYIEEKHPNAKVTIACGPLATSLFEGYPLLEKIYFLKKEKYNGHWFKLWKKVGFKRWDMVIDLRDSIVSRVLMTNDRYIFSKQINKAQHKVLQNAQAMNLSPPPAPKLWFSDKQKRLAEMLIPDGSPVLGVGPTANWIGKTWPAKNFIEIVDYMTREGGVMSGARVAVFSAPGEEEAARQVLASIPKDRQLDIIAKTDPGTAAATIARCEFYLGNDSGLMHCAAAAGVKTVGVFGPSYPHIYAPYGDHCSYARTPESFDELIDFEGYTPQSLKHTLMNSLTIEMVKDKINAIN